jgi:hypothetical protein
VHAYTERTLNEYRPSSNRFRVIGDVSKSYQGEMGPITTVDTSSRLHYSLLQAAPKPWLPSTDCAAAPCASGSLCCAFPPYRGACFQVPACAALDQPNMTAPFHLVALSVDTAQLAPHMAPAVCSITANDCPWSLEAAGKGMPLH